MTILGLLQPAVKMSLYNGRALVLFRIDVSVFENCFQDWQMPISSILSAYPCDGELERYREPSPRFCYTDLRIIYDLEAPNRRFYPNTVGELLAYICTRET